MYSSPNIIRMIETRRTRWAICVAYMGNTNKTKTNSVALVSKRTIPTERPPLVYEVSANFLRIKGVAWSAQWIPTAVFSVF
jgi:hypothetical protein